MACAPLRSALPQILGVSRTHLAEPFVGGALVFPDCALPCPSFVSWQKARKTSNKNKDFLSPPNLTILATSYRSAEAPSRQKCRKSALESASPKRGAEESAEKVLRPSSLCISNTEVRRPKRFFGTFLGTPFGAGTFRSTFSALLSGRGFGTSVAGRQDCIPNP